MKILPTIQTAEKIADHFSEISQECQPVDTGLLPNCVQRKLKEYFPLPQLLLYRKPWIRTTVAKKQSQGSLVTCCEQLQQQQI